MARFTNLLGYEWMPIMEMTLPTREPETDTRADVPLRTVYSVDTPFLELVEEVPGTTWVCNEQSNLHHIGFWCDQLSAESGRLVAAGCPLQLSGYAADSAEPLMYAYHRDELGVRIELVDDLLRPMIEGGVAP